MRYPQFTGDYDLNATNVPSAQYAWLLGIEQNAMRRTGKRGEFEFCRDEANHPLMTQFQDFDWADEVNTSTSVASGLPISMTAMRAAPRPPPNRRSRSSAGRRSGGHRDAWRAAMVSKQTEYHRG